MGGPLEYRFCLHCCVNVGLIEIPYGSLRLPVTGHDGNYGFKFMEYKVDLEHESHSAGYFR